MIIMCINLFLIAIFPIFFLYALNFSEISKYAVKTILLPLNLTLVSLTGLGVILSNFYFLNYHKSIIFVTLFLTFFYNATKLYKKIVDRKYKDFYTPKYIYAFIFLVLQVLLAVFLKNTNFDFSIINILLLCILALIYLSFINNIYVEINKNKGQKFNDIYFQTIEKLESLPDIYHFVLDGYARNDTLKKNFNFDNSEITTFLQNKGFEIIENAKSNYPSTKYSLSSILNFDYVPNLSTKEIYKSIQNNKLVHFLKNANYKYCHIKNWWDYSSISEKTDSFNLYVFLSFIKDIFCDSLLGLFFYKWFRYYKVATLALKKELDEVTDKIEKDSPKFVYYHSLITHWPFLLGKNGELNFNEKDNYKQYLIQVEHANNKIQEYVNKILERNPNSIIIIHGDHNAPASMMKNEAYSKTFEEEKYNIFAAIYTPDKENLFENIKTPINFYRKILNEFFNQNLNLLEEKQYDKY